MGRQSPPEALIRCALTRSEFWTLRKPQALPTKLKSLFRAPDLKRMLRVFRGEFGCGITVVGRNGGRGGGAGMLKIMRYLFKGKWSDQFVPSEFPTILRPPQVSALRPPALFNMFYSLITELTDVQSYWGE